jgi:hypothetical protein
LKPTTAARLLRAKASELEHLVLADAEIASIGEQSRIADLTADVALLFSLLADEVERRVEAEGPWVPLP